MKTGGVKTGRREEEAHGRGRWRRGEEGERRRDAARPPCLGSAGSRPRGRFPAWWLAVGPPLVCCVRGRRRCRPCHFVCHVVSFAARLPRNPLHVVHFGFRHCLDLHAVSSSFSSVVIVWFHDVVAARGGVSVVGVSAVFACGLALWPWSQLGAAPGPPCGCRCGRVQCRS